MTFTPDHLKKPTLQGHIYGDLRYSEANRVFVMEGEPLALEFAKRLFPGSLPYGRGMVGMKHSKRVINDLNWFLLRFPLNIHCQKELNTSRKEAINAINRRATGDDLIQTTPPKEFIGKLMPFQEEAVTFLNVNKRAILGDAMGLGKTWSALAAAAQSGQYPVLIVCQTQTLKQWQRAIGSLFDMGSSKVGKYDDPFTAACKRGEMTAPILRTRTPYVIPNTPFSIIHYGLLQDWGVALRDKGYPVVIFDEVQELRHTESKKYSEASLLSSDAEYVFGLSGTPVYGYGVEMWSVTNAIDFQCLGSKDVFTREWCRGYGDKIVENPKALNDLLVREGLLLRRKYKDENVRISLPTVDRKIIDLAHDTDIYDSLISTAQQHAGMYNLASFNQKGRIARLIDQQTRMASGMAKAPFAADFIQSLIEAGEKPLVYAWHHGVYDILLDKLRGFNPSVITGKQSPNQKDKALEKFSNGDTDLCILSLRSAAGLDGLQDRATCCVFVELDWSPAIHAQAETRIARIGVSELLKEIPSYYCVSSTSFDEVVMDVLGVKTGQFLGLMGDEPEDSIEQKASEERAVQRIKTLVKQLGGVIDVKN